MNRRAVVLLGVLIVVVLASIIGAAVLRRSDAHQDLAEASLGAMQSRSLAWSGVLAAQSELAAQRQGLLSGEGPEVRSSWTCEVQGGVGVVRLRRWRGQDGAPGPLLISEAGHLDVNHATAEMLAKLPGVDEAIAAAIVAKRGAGLECVEALAGLSGVEERTLYGEDEPTSGASQPGEAEAGPGLLSLLTTFSFDPNVQAGIGEGNAQYAGRSRINLGLKWSQELEEAFKERFGEDVTKMAAEIFKNREPLKKDSEFVALLQEKNVPPEEWGVMLDIFTTANDLYRLGKVDLSSAPAPVLAAIPGIDAAAAERIVQTRDSLAADLKQDVAWPLREGILSKEQFLQAVDWMGTRCMQYRVRVEAGIAAQGAGEIDDLDGVTLQRAVVFEAVLDVSGPVARVAYLRDVTHLDRARAIVRESEVARRAQDGTEGGAAEAAAPQTPRDPAPVKDRAARMGGRAQEKKKEDRDTRADKAKDSEVEAPGQEVPVPELAQPSPTDRRLGRWTSKPRR
ncbi:MAG: helix-hairpin-helix domain-containing protein [Phycisphaerales bacterium]